MTITDAVLRPIIKSSSTWNEVFRKLHRKASGGFLMSLQAACKKFEISTAHFTGRAWMKGRPHAHRLSPENVLKPSRYRKPHYQLKRALVESGVKYECAVCGLGPNWCGKPLTLEVDHKNGNGLDNSPGNPRFICPNCHSQTPTYKSKNWYLQKRLVRPEGLPPST